MPTAKNPLLMQLTVMTTKRHLQGDTKPAIMNADLSSDLPETVKREINVLSALDIDALRTRYRRLMRKPAPAHLRSWLLVRILAYELQVRAFGGLDSATEKFLDKLTERIEKKRAAAAANGAVFRPATKTICALVPAVKQPARLIPGALLIREYAGKEHRVTVVEHGFLWNDVTFGSLSEVAKAITGTNWSGPRFFGLIDERRRPRDADSADS
ncbi:MAG: hypothetical protein RLZZ444_2164 [Pseudomonadota bacterium]|jgi:hypothetical protein